MMKKMWALMLALCLMLTAGCAMAAEGSIMPEYDEKENFLRVSDLAVVGEDVYLLCCSGTRMSLWRWTEGMEMAEMLRDDFLRADSLAPETPTQGAGNAVTYAIAALVSDGQRLMGVNPVSGLVFQIHPEEDGVTFTDIVTLQEPSRFFDFSRYGNFFASPTAVAASGDYLYWYGNGWDAAREENRSRITCYSLVDGSFFDVPAERVTTLCAWKDGKICLLSRAVPESEDDWTLPYIASLYDPANGSITKIGEIDTSRSINRIAYAPALDMLLWQEGTNILGMKPDGGETLCAYVPTSNGGRLAAAGDTLVLSVPRKTAVRQLVPGLTAPEVLRVLHGSYDETAEAFADKYPDVPLETINESLGDDGYEPWLTPADGSDGVDVVRLYTSNGDGDFTALRDAGLLMDLSFDADIVAYIDRLYPPFREFVTGEKGEIWAVPTETVSYTGFFVNRRAMTDMGFSKEDMPTNLVDLCAFITMWDAEYADRYPNYCCIEYAENTRRFLADMALDMWIGHCQAQGRQVRFDDPEFRKVMDAIAKVSTVRTERGMQVTNPEISDYKSGLFWVDCQLVGNWAAYMEDYSDRIFIPMALTADTPYHAEVEGVELWTISSRSAGAQYAAAFVREQIGHINNKYAHVLLTDRTETVESPYFAEQAAWANRELGEMQMQLLSADTPEEEASVRRIIERQEAYIAGELQRSKYEITPSAVDNYVSVIAPAMFIRRENVLQHTSEGVNALENIRDRWLKGVITTEQLVRELDARLLMLELNQ